MEKLDAWPEVYMQAAIQCGMCKVIHMVVNNRNVTYTLQEGEEKLVLETTGLEKALGIQIDI